MNQMMTYSLQQQLDLEVNYQVTIWKKNTILKMEKNMWELQKPHIGIWCWIDEFWEHKKDM